MANETIEKMKKEVYNIYLEAERRYLDKCKELASLLKLFKFDYYDYYEDSDNGSILMYRVYKDNHVYMSYLYDEDIYAINELMAKENIENKSFDWIVRRTEAILDFFNDYEKIYGDMYDTLFYALTKNLENLKNKYKEVANDGE